MTHWTEEQLMAFVARGRRAQRAIDIVTFKMTEKQWQQDVKDLARMLGWKTYHTFDSRKSDPDFPDLVMARCQKVPLGRGTHSRLIIAELKVGKNQPTAGQQEWLNFFKDIGAETYVWYPEDIEEVKRVLR